MSNSEDCTEIVPTRDGTSLKMEFYRNEDTPGSTIGRYCLDNEGGPPSSLIFSVESAKCKCSNSLDLEDQNNQNNPENPEKAKKSYTMTSKIICPNCINSNLQVTPIPGQCQQCNNYLASCHNLYCGPCSWNHQKCSVCGTIIDLPS